MVGLQRAKELYALDRVHRDHNVYNGYRCAAQVHQGKVNVRVFVMDLLCCVEFES